MTVEIATALTVLTIFFLFCAFVTDGITLLKMVGMFIAYTLIVSAIACFWAWIGLPL